MSRKLNVFIITLLAVGLLCTLLIQSNQSLRRRSFKKTDERLDASAEKSLLKFTQAAEKKNLRPIIGVYSMHCHMKSCLRNEFTLKKYDPQIPASYIKFLESAGARVVPISFRANKFELDRIFQGINGLLYVGGKSSIFSTQASSAARGGLTSWGDNAFYLLNKAIEANKRGDFFPVLGICKGLQTMIHHMKNSNAKIFSNIRNLNKADNIKILEGYENSLLFAGFSNETKNYIQSTDALYFNNYNNMPVEVFKSNSFLNNFYNITSTYTLNGANFVGTIEARSGAPLIGIIWHPEKAWEWKDNVNATRDIENLKATQELANRFVDLCRRNNHQFVDPLHLSNNLIYNYLSFDPDSVMHNQVYFLKLTKNNIRGSLSGGEGEEEVFVPLEEEEAS